jgi:hypothetical protein
MSARIAVAIAVVVLGSVLPGASRAGSYLPPPGDTRPSWSPDSERIAFVTERSGRALVEVSANGGAETRLVEGAGILGAVISPTGAGWRSFATSPTAARASGYPGPTDPRRVCSPRQARAPSPCGRRTRAG